MSTYSKVTINATLDPPFSVSNTKLCNISQQSYGIKDPFSVPKDSRKAIYMQQIHIGSTFREIDIVKGKSIWRCKIK